MYLTPVLKTPTATKSFRERSVDLSPSCAPNTLHGLYSILRQGGGGGGSSENWQNARHTQLTCTLNSCSSKDIERALPLAVLGELLTSCCCFNFPWLGLGVSVLLRMLALALDRRLCTLSSIGAAVVLIEVIAAEVVGSSATEVVEPSATEVVGPRDTGAGTTDLGVDVTSWEAVVLAGVETGTLIESAKAIWCLVRGRETDFCKRANQPTS